MIYAQFYDYNLSGNLDEALGDRSVVIVDGRWAPKTIGKIAAAECRKRKYVAWRIFRGETFTRSCAPVSQLNYVHDDAPVRNPVWLSAHN
jgi:hypothetical protein